MRFAAIVLWAAALAQSSRPGQIFERAYFLEQGKGDLEGAVELYESLVEEFPEERALAARALLRIGLCHERLGVEAAASAYRRLLQGYADQEEAARIARARLDALRIRRAGPSVDLPSGATLREILLADGRRVGDSSATISRDGRNLAYVDSELRRMVVYDLVEQRTLLSAPVSVEEGNFVYRWSRDGRRLAFDQLRGQNRVVDVVDLDGGKVTEIFYRPGQWGFMVDWSPDGREFLLSTGGGGIRRLMLMDGNGHNLLELPLEGWEHRLSPDGKWIAFQGDGDDEDIYLDSLSQNPPDKVPVSPHSSSDVNPVWSPDGHYLAFRSNRAKSWDLWVVEIEEGRPLGLPLRVHGDIGEDAYLQEWLPDGRLAFTKRNRLGDIWIQPVDPNTGKASGPGSLMNTAVRGANGQPRWAPDGSRIVFRSQRERYEGTLFLADLVDGTETVLPTPGGHQNADWYPDGQALVYSAFTDEGLKLARLDLASRETEFLKTEVRFEAVPAPEVSPDGKRILFNIYSPDTSTSAMYVLDEERGTTTLIPGTEGVYRARWSPDGESIAFVRDLEVCTIRLDGSAARSPVRLSEPEHANAWLSWSPDGRFVVYPRGRLDGNSVDWDLWVASLDGSVHHPVGEPASANPWWVDWSADGRYLALASAGGTSSFWVLENFFRGDRPEP